MRFLVQRVTEGRVEIDGRVVGAIGQGFVVLVGFGVNDAPDLPGSRIWNAMLDKLVALRVFPDAEAKMAEGKMAEGKMNVGLAESGGSILLVPQFTLYADCHKGRRPSFHLAAPPDTANRFFAQCAADLASRLPGRVALGIFGADMRVSLTNWGPVTVLLDSDELFPA